MARYPSGGCPPARNPHTARARAADNLPVSGGVGGASDRPGRPLLDTAGPALEPDGADARARLGTNPLHTSLTPVLSGERGPRGGGGEPVQ